MELTIEHLVPVPLKEKLSNRTSDIWNISRSFLQGQKVKIKAPSGTGKTTLVHILYKLRHDYEGKVLWNEKLLSFIKNDELADIRQQKVSIIFQDLRLFENLSARENIELNRVLYQPMYESSKIDEMAAYLGVSHILNQKAGMCSYGEQQRIAIIRALIQPFEWLIMDEPFSHLDHDNIAKSAKLITDECAFRNAGFIITDLEDDNHFNYTHRYHL